MNKATKSVMIASAVGAAAVAAYSSMRPSAKREMKKDFRKAVSHVDGVKEELCDVRRDMTEMARNLKNQI
ncbi:MAG: hypothetical protein SOW80_09070 [Anaerovoracaceae bacterium]|nr:hypothetical protein [Anaerovoracaceae bacterium]